jgi:hypothetical protein
MRNWLIAFIIVFMSCDAGVEGKNGIRYKNAAEYNEYIMENQKDIVNVFLEFGKAVENDLDSADRTLDKGVKISDKALFNLKGMPAFKGDSAFRNAAIQSFEFYGYIIANEYRQIISIRRKGVNQTDEDFAFLNGLPELIGKREEKYDRAFHNAQKAFADKNNLSLVKNELQDKVDQAEEKKQ